MAARSRRMMNFQPYNTVFVPVIAMRMRGSAILNIQMTVAHFAAIG
jgi:hypothetical protein